MCSSGSARLRTSGMRSASRYLVGGVPRGARALEQARARGWRLCILSNTDRDFIDASMAAIGVPFDRWIVASEIGCKAGSRPLAGVREGVGRLPDAHVAASLFHDVAPTSELGIPASGSTGSAKIRRVRLASEFPTLASLAKKLDELAA